MLISAIIPALTNAAPMPADRNIIGDQEIRFPYDFIDTSHNGVNGCIISPTEMK